MIRTGFYGFFMSFIGQFKRAFLTDKLTSDGAYADGGVSKDRCEDFRLTLECQGE